MPFPGIYKIINKTNGKYYVGSSLIPSRRWKQHKYELNKNVHANDYLQRSWNKYSQDNFVFIIVETLSPTVSDDKLLEHEQKWLDIAREDYKNRKCYNLTFVANNPNMLLSDYSKAKRSASLKKVIKTNEWKKKISESHIGIRPTIATRIKMSESRRGKRQTEKQKFMAAESRKKDWVLFNPNGDVVHIHDLKSFCKENNLHSGNMYWVASGKRRQYKGWTSELSRKKKNLREKTYTFLSPNGDQIKIINLKRFCRENLLCSTSMFNVASEKTLEYKGWRKHAI